MPESNSTRSTTRQASSRFVSWSPLLVAILAALMQWARERWPHAAIGAATQSDPCTITHGVAAYDGDAERDDIAQLILERAQDTWMDDAATALAGE